MVAIAPETQEHVRRLAQSRALPFAVLTDLDLGYALSLGLVFWVGEEVKRIYQQLGFNLDSFQRNDGRFLPIPATFVLGRDGRIAARYIDPEFPNRMPIEDILRALKDGRS
jgi:peroxiredoxin